MKRAFRLFLWALSPVVIYLILAVVGALAPSLQGDVGPQSDERQIVLAAGRIHYDILLPVDAQTLARFDFVQDAGVPLSDPSIKWLAVGWGSEAFYTTTGRYSDVSLGSVWTAATGDAGVIRFEVYGALPDHPSLRRVSLSALQLDVLTENILKSLEPDRQVLPIAGFSPTDAFFPARGRFHLLRTCNVWVGTMLTSSGLRFGWWTPTPYAVTLSLWWNGHLDV